MKVPTKNSKVNNSLLNATAIVNFAKEKGMTEVELLKALKLIKNVYEIEEGHSLDKECSFCGEKGAEVKIDHYWFCSVCINHINYIEV